MPFKAILKDLCDRTGGTGAIMLDWEGEAVDYFALNPNIELTAIGAHKGIILNLLRDATARVDNEALVESIGITTKNTKIAIVVLKDGYYVLLTLRNNDSMARGLFETKRAAKKLLANM